MERGGVMNEIQEIIYDLQGVLCNPDGEPCIGGSNADNEVICNVFKKLEELSNKDTEILDMIDMYIKNYKGMNIGFHKTSKEMLLDNEQRAYNIRDLITKAIKDGS